MNEKRFYLRLLMALVMITMSPTMILADSVFTYTATSDLSSKFQTAFSSDGTVTCGTWTDATTPVTVTVNGDVTSISTDVFKFCSDLTSITIPDGVTSIGEDVFYYCSGLQNINIPNSVTSIGNETFSGCSGLQSVTIPSSVTSIGNETFCKCSGLKTIIIPDGVTSIGEDAFSNCTNLQSITISKSVTSIDVSAFEYCTKLESISVDAENKYYDSRNNCNALIKTADNFLIKGCNNTTIPNDVTSIREKAFYGCSGLQSVTIPSSVTSISNETFKNCSGLKTINIPDGVTSIGREAFYNCNSLQSITIPSSVTSIGSSAFSGCNSLQSITIPSSVTSIGGLAFSGCNSLQSITIPSSVTSIGGSAFSGCYMTIGNLHNASTIDLTSYGLTIVDTEQEDGLLIKDNSAIMCRQWATSVTIPNGVTSIGREAFRGYINLQSIAIPASVTKINYAAFMNCKNLTSTTFYSIPYIDSAVFYQVPSTCTHNLILSDDSYVYPDKNTYLPDFTSAQYSCMLTSEWETLVLPFAVTVSENNDYDLCTITGISGSTLQPVIATGTIAAGTFVLIHKKVEGNYALTLTADNCTVSTTLTARTPLTGFTLTGTYATISVASGTGYVLNGSSFKQTTEDTNVAPFRFYIKGNVSGVDALSLPHVHRFVKKDAVAATCTSTGTIAYWTCSECEKLYSDAEGKTEITLADITTPITHDYVNGICSLCHALEPATQVTAENYASLGFTEQNYSAYVDYYAIGNAGQMAWFRDYVNTGVTEGETTTYPNATAKAVLTADIDLSSVCHAADAEQGIEAVKWTPIGKYAAPYKGVFDGQGHSITGMSILNYTSGYHGLFGRVEGTYVGDSAEKTVVLKNFTLSGSMTSSKSAITGIGGVVGSATNALIQNVACNVSITIDASTKQTNIGGVVGFCSATLVSGCTYSGTLDAGACVACIAGIAGDASSYTEITNCLNTGDIYSTGNARIAGILGSINDANFKGVNNCLNIGSITAASGAGAIYGLFGSYTTNIGSNNYYKKIDNITGVGKNETRKIISNSCKYVTEAKLSKGEICWLLNGSTSTGTLAWYQKLDTDAYPVLKSTGDNTVYYGYSGTCQEKSYSNSEISETPDHQYENGYCTLCGTIQPATVVTSKNYASLGFTNKNYSNYLNYYAIGNAGQMVWFRDFVNTSVTEGTTTTYPNATAKAVLTADIDLSSVCHAANTEQGIEAVNWTPIGNNDGPYNGTFDGQGYSITGMSILDYTTGYQGLFGKTDGATLKNFTLSGSMTSSTTHTDAATVNYIGGVAGYANSSNVTNVVCNVSITLGTGTKQIYIGGITGCCNKSSISGCTYSGTLDAGASVNCIAGIAGYTTTTAEIKNCLNAGDITSTGNARIAGILGYISSADFNGVNNCLNIGSITAPGTKRGAIYGEFTSTTTNTGSNNYYKEVKVDGVNTIAGVGTNGSVNPESACTSVTEEKLSTGEVCWLLNGSTSTGTLAWYQKLGTDAYPVLKNTGNNTVYKDGYLNCYERGYSNSATPLAHHFDSDGFCDLCHNANEPATKVTAENYSSLGFTAENYSPYLGYYAIDKKGQLYWFAENARGNSAVLTKDIVVNENVLNADLTLKGDGSNLRQWTPFNLSSSKTFDGNGHTISGLYYNGNGENVGLVGHNYGTIRNVGVKDSYFVSTSTIACSGALCGNNQYYAIITNSFAMNVAVTGNNAGGLCGRNSTACTVSNCYAVNLKVTGSTNAGGVCGYKESGDIINCYTDHETPIGSGSGTAVSTKSPDAFASGEVCWLLNDGKTIDKQEWYQKLPSQSAGSGQETPADSYPVLKSTGDNTVYCGYVDCINMDFFNTADYEIPGEHVCINFICKVCGAEPTSLTTGTLQDKSVYQRTKGLTVADFTYTRQFEGTYWTTWYVPFALPLTDDICAHYDFSRIRNVHQYDDNADGDVDRTVIESFRQKSGKTLKANYPYLVRARSNDDKAMTITLQDVDLAKAEANSIDCQSVNFNYNFTGTYTEMGDGETPSTLYTLFDADKDDGSYGWEHFYTLSPQRHYLTITSRDGSNSAKKAPRCIILMDMGETTDIEDLTPDISQEEKVGKYLENGKVVVIRNGKKYNVNGQVIK